MLSIKDLGLKNQMSKFPPVPHFLLSVDRDQFSPFLHYGKERMGRQSFAHLARTAA